MSSSDKLELAIDALRAGAFDMVLKLIRKESFNESVLAAWQHKAVIEERSRVRHELDDVRVQLTELQKVLETERAMKMKKTAAELVPTAPVEVPAPVAPATPPVSGR